MTTKKVLLKVIILGESGVGKTALLNHYVNNQFIETHKATIGADFMTKDIKIDDKMITLQMWDTAGQERFKSLGNSFYRGADAAILVYDITQKETFTKIEEWKSSFLDLSGESKEFPILLLGNKYDLQNQRAVDSSDGEAYAQKQGMIFYETSAVNGHNIEEAVRAIAAKACDRDTAPYDSVSFLLFVSLLHILRCFRVFSADVIKQLDFSEKEEETAQAPCACELL